MVPIVVVVVVNLPLSAPLPSLAGGRRHRDAWRRLCVRFTEDKKDWYLLQQEMKSYIQHSNL